MRSRRIVLFAVVAGVGYLTDLITKIIAVARLEDADSVVLIPHVLHLTFVRNAGAAFGMATGFTIVLTAIALTVCVVVVRMARQLRDPLWAVGLGFLLAGALGNLTDRLFREPSPLQGHVVDFLQFPDWPPNWPVFNIADVMINLAAVIIVVQTIRGIGLDGVKLSQKTGAADESSEGEDEDATTDQAPSATDDEGGTDASDQADPR